MGSRHEAADSRLKLEQLLTEKIRELGMRAHISGYLCVGSDRYQWQNSLSLTGGEIVDSGIGLSYRPASLCSLAVIKKDHG